MKDPQIPSDGEPDYRFTLANERTFLAWVRTSLALVAGGVAVTQLLPHFGPGALWLPLGLVLVGLAFSVSAFSYRHWVRMDQAIRQQRPLPRTRMPLILALSVGGVILLALVLILSS